MSLSSRELFNSVLRNLNVDFQRFTIDYEEVDWFGVNIRFLITLSDSKPVETENVYLHDKGLLRLNLCEDFIQENFETNQHKYMELVVERRVIVNILESIKKVSIKIVETERYIGYIFDKNQLPIVLEEIIKEKTKNYVR